MSFFSRRKQSQSAAPTNVLVGQSPSQALAQTRDNNLSRGPTPMQNGMSQQMPLQGGQRDRDYPQPQMAGLPQHSSASPPTNMQPQSQLRTTQPPPASARQPTWPWSAKNLTMLPQSPIPRTQAPPINGSTALSAPPFPRYGHSVPATSNQNGELFLFGGLLRDSVRNDLYAISTRDMTAALWQVHGDIPCPRVGHASALLSNVLIVWGGDTKTDGRTQPNEKQDDGLYLLNLVTREWTRVEPEGPKPVGRYGHAVTMIGTRFYVFGGQVDGVFMNDLWCFDLNSLVNNEPRWELCTPAPGKEPPLCRTGHACIAYGEQLYVFGGTDGQYHYNDTWCYDPPSRVWSELKCIGFIPVPREGHSAALVDDVMYIFGGRGVDGKDLGDLTGFKIGNRRWYMFQNMGPSPPSGRSGHAMSAIATRVFVLGGESYTTSTQDDPTAVHILDTKHIRYPDASKHQPRKTSVGSGAISGQPSRAMSPQNAISDLEHLRNQAVSPARSVTSQTVANNTSIMGSLDMNDGSINHIRGESSAVPMDSSGMPRPSLEQAPSRMTDINPERAVSPESASRKRSQPNHIRSLSTEEQRSGIDVPQNAGKELSQLANLAPVTATAATSTGVVPNGIHVSNGVDHSTDGSGHERQQIEQMKAREAWLKSLLFKAMREGRVSPTGDTGDIKSEFTGQPGTEDALRAILQLRHMNAKLQSSIQEHAQKTSQQTAEALRLRNVALQETAFYRAQAAVLQSGSSADFERLHDDRLRSLERKLSTLTSEYKAQEHAAEEYRQAASTQMRLREQAELKAAEALKRTEFLDDSHERLTREVSSLQSKHMQVQSALRDHEMRLIEETSRAERHLMDHKQAKTQLEGLQTQQMQHRRFLEQTQIALDAASTRAYELDRQHQQATLRLSEVEAELIDTRAELETRTGEANAATARMRDVENAWAKSREEADSLRALTTRGLGELLDHHRDAGNAETRASQNHIDKIQQLEEEVTLLRSSLASANTKIDDAHADAVEHRTRLLDTDGQHNNLMMKLGALRSELVAVHSEKADLQRQVSLAKQQLEQASHDSSKVEIKHAMLKGFLVDNDILMDIENNESSHDLAQQLTDLQKRYNQLSIERQAEQRELGLLRSAQNGILPAERVVNSRSPGGSSNSDEPSSQQNLQIQDLRKALAESEQTHQERIRQLESDYQTAVHYVKGTEKMLRRMRDELSKQKGVNAALQTEIDSYQSSNLSNNKQSRGINGRGTPTSDDTGESSLRTQILELRRQNQRITTEHDETRRLFDVKEKELRDLQSHLQSAQQDARERADEVEKLEMELEHLENTMSLASGGQIVSSYRQLEVDNNALRRKNDELSKKIELLLEVDQAEFGHRPISTSSDRRLSQTNSDHVRAFENLSNELEDWHRTLADGKMADPNAANAHMM